MPATKPASRVINKYVARAGVAQPEYTQGIQDAGEAWATNAAAGDANYRSAVTAAAAAGRFAAGIREAGNAKWRAKSLAKGPGRFVEGVIDGQADYGAQIAKVLATITAVTLPPRGPTGSPQNFQRIQPIGAALRTAFGKAGAGAPR